YYRFHECGVDISEFEHRKGDGIGYIMKALGLKRDEAISFGDDTQDITMKEGSIFVCVGNGKDEVKQAADYVSPPIVDDGIEEALKHYGVLV
ncbi:MAG: HAD hydrolase family protein, partial [Bacilli bacterium]|nr:HAD hydrolase family protein [Bacilli bacterium]